MGMKRKHKKQIRDKIRMGLELQEQARADYKQDLKNLEAAFEMKKELAYDDFNGKMTDVGYVLASIEMKYTKEDYPELWI